MKKLIWIYSLILILLASSHISAHKAEIIFSINTYNGSTRTIYAVLYQVEESTYDHSLGKFITSGH